MSPMLNKMLVTEVVPRLRATARSIPKIGHEDDQEIIQDATLMAARMMESAEKAGVSYEELLQRIINMGLRWRPDRLG